MVMHNMTSGLYDLTNVSTSESVLEFTQAVNNLTNGYLMLGVLVVGFFILFLSTMRWGVRDALASSSFITAVLAVFFLTLEFITLKFFLIVAIPAGILFVMAMLNN